MKVAIINITQGGISGGYRKYLSNIIPRMAAHPLVKSILCVFPLNLNVGDWLGPIPHVEYLACRPWNLLSYGLCNELKKHLEIFSPDVIFIPTERSFNFRKVPIVNMVQNMESLSGFNEGNPLLERAKNWFRAYCAKRALNKSDRIIAISQYVKEFLINDFHVQKNRIRLIYYGADSCVKSNNNRPFAIPVDWGGEFIFTAGSIRPARGLEDIILALAYLKKENIITAKLVIAGDVSPNMSLYQKKLKRWIERSGLSDKVRWVSNLNENEMIWCYKNCKVFIMTSRVESFGQIALEAMSQGCICMSADNPCLPEIFNDAAVYYTPKDRRFLAKSLRSVIDLNPRQKEVLSEKAKNRAKEFSWDVCVNKTVEELVKACKS